MNVLRKFSEPLEPRRLLSAGDLDPTFGTGGRSIQPLAGEFITSSIVLSDDKILLAGGAELSNGKEGYFLRKLNADGSVDTAFGTDGDVTGTLGGPAGSSIANIFPESDGQVLAAAVVNQKPAIARFNSDGTLDSTFDASGVLTGIAGTLQAVEPDGRMITLLSQYFPDTGNTEFTVTRYQTNGAIDKDFGKNGTIDSGLSQAGGEITVQPDGKLLLGGTVTAMGEDQYFLERFNSNGSLDTTFGTGGQLGVSSSTMSIMTGELSQIMPLPNGKILVGGEDESDPEDILSGPEESLQLIRLNANGSIDQSFAPHGVSIPMGRFFDEVNLSVDANGNTVLVGLGGSVAVARVTASGKFDPSFGLVIGDNGAIDSLDIVGSGIQSNGDIVLVGKSDVLKGPAHIDSSVAFGLLSSGTTPPPISLNSASKTLSIEGTASDDLIEVDEGYGLLQTQLNGFGRAFSTSDASSLSINGDAGNDQIIADVQSIPASISGGDGSDKITGGEKNDTLLGNAGRDFIDGGLGADLIEGNGGNDQLRGQGGADHIYGGAGNDYIEGDGGNDRLDGGAGSDLLHGNAGNDMLTANDGTADSLFGDGGTDAATVDPSDVLTSIESIM